MRKIQKQQILDFIKSLDQAHEEIREVLCRKNTESAQIMLGECQDFAVALGESIEKIEGSGHITVSYIEDYCETLFHIFNNITNNQTHENMEYKALKKSLLKIENSIKNDINVRKEVVFFPYKASMWDSLESLYFEAQEDSECDVFCVPIPYYDLNPNHSFGQMHYDGKEYPSNIEVTDWKTYRFEERKPDEIYIHNAYDNCNLVTSVHPRFYSNNLKKYTENLIYSPYFVVGEIDPSDQKTIDRMKHFCFLPGIINADRVIIESENIKKIYINEYIKAAKKSGLTGHQIERSYLEKKFDGSGSPKYKKVLNTKKEDVNIPIEWMRIIEKPDGSLKKILFFNSTIKAILENEDKVIKKIKEVFNVFKEKKEEIALIWRPHPLLENTLKAMRPMLLQEYREIVEQYKNEKWGIYDDTSDMNRAIALSDAYYGDPSSVVQLYKRTNKPIMITDYK